MAMPDGNTSAERLRDRSESDAESLHDIYGERVIEDVIDHFFSGKTICRLNVRDFMPELDGDDIETLIFGGEERADDVRERIIDQTAESIRKWCESAGADYVAEKVCEWAKDDADGV